MNFVLGEGDTCDIVDGLEIALKKFKKGEKSKIKIASKYGYGSKGFPEKNIPPDADLVYEVTLKEFEKVGLCLLKNKRFLVAHSLLDVQRASSLL